MLASIHPLGERSRNNRWLLTVSAYLTGSLAAGALLGTLLGLAGRGAGVDSWVGRPVTAAVVGVLAILALVADAARGRVPLPGARRQVNEDWLRRYRGWVYGVGFGFQLGLGVATIVTTASLYLVFVLAFLSGSAAAGALIGLSFGLARGVLLLGMANVHGPDQLRAAHRRLQGWNTAAWRMTLVGEAALVAGALTGAVR
jgi:sulfite exporter TauE/SafE